MIYGRFGNPVAIVRIPTLADVKALDHREPDEQDREALRNGSYVVIIGTNGDNDRVERLYHRAFLRADGGSREVTEAIDALVASYATTA